MDRPCKSSRNPLGDSWKNPGEEEGADQRQDQTGNSDESKDTPVDLSGERFHDQDQHPENEHGNFEIGAAITK